MNSDDLEDKLEDFFKAKLGNITNESSANVINYPKEAQPKQEKETDSATNIMSLFTVFPFLSIIFIGACALCISFWSSREDIEGWAA